MGQYIHHLFGINKITLILLLIVLTPLFKHTFSCRLSLTKIKATTLCMGFISLYLSYFFIFLSNPIFDGDQINIIAGAAQLAKGFETTVLYRYDNQPLTYWILSIGAQVFNMDLPFASQKLAQMSLIISLILIFLIAQETFSFSGGLLILIFSTLIHELIINGTYYNSSIMAMPFLYTAVYILIKYRYQATSFILANIILATSFYVRNDTILFLPAVYFVYLIKRKFALSLIGIFIFCSTLVFLNIFLNINLSNIYFHANDHMTHFTRTLPQMLIHLFSAAPLMVFIMAILGVIQLFITRQYMFLSIFLAAIGPTVIFYAKTFTTPKYFLYIYPILAGLMYHGWLLIKNLRNKELSHWLKSFFVFFVTWQSFLCLINIDFPTILHKPLIRLRRPKIIFTHDGYRPLTGSLLFPFVQNKEQKNKFKYYQETLEKLSQKSINTIFWTDNWDFRGILNYHFSIRADSAYGINLFNIAPFKDEHVYTIGNRTVRVHYARHLNDEDYHKSLNLATKDKTTNIFIVSHTSGLLSSNIFKKARFVAYDSPFEKIIILPAQP